jgi:predicted nuclease with TOPRIM domain
MEITSEQFDEIKKKMAHLEYDEIKELKEQIQGIKEDMVRNNMLLEQSIATSSKLSDTLSTVQEAMIKLTSNMQYNNEATVNLSNKVTNLEIKIDSIDQNSKIDMHKWFKDRWFNIVMLIGIVLYMLFGKYITF